MRPLAFHVLLSVIITLLIFTGIRMLVGYVSVASTITLMRGIHNGNIVIVQCCYTVTICISFCDSALAGRRLSVGVLPLSVLSVVSAKCSPLTTRATYRESYYD